MRLYDLFPPSRRDVCIRDYKTGKVVFAMSGVLAPEDWGDDAVRIVASRYFRKAGVPQTQDDFAYTVHDSGLYADAVEVDPERLDLGAVASNGHTLSVNGDGYVEVDGAVARGPERSVYAVARRMAEAWAAAGVDQGLISGDEAVALRDESLYMILAQVASPNSPQWFNTGLYGSYGLGGSPTGSHYRCDPEDGRATAVDSAYEYPATSACFIQSVDDTLCGENGIVDLLAREARVFKFGGGSGVNPSTLRGEGERLSGGGTSSGLMSWLKMLDAAAGSIKSGGTCLAPGTLVYTTRGPVPVKDLCGEDFVAISYDPAEGRYGAKVARAFHAGRKRVVRVTTEGGSFDLTDDHPMKVAYSGEYAKAGSLRPGTMLWACSIRKSRAGSIEVGPRDGKRGALHRIVARVDARGHRVVSVETIGDTDVYDVEVDCSTDDDKTPMSGHNFVIWPSAEPTGSGVVVSNTRRAAKIVVLDDDHPDLEKFITLKAREELKVLAMVAGADAWSDADGDFASRIGLALDSDFNGDAYRTVDGQNANYSVSLSDAFMDALERDGTWYLTDRVGDGVRGVRASEIFRLIAECAWRSADPGLQFSGAMNRWNTCKVDGKIRGTNPCGEYVWFDDTACNLASINVLKFIRTDGGFDVDGFIAAVRVWTVVLEITVGMSSYPSVAIAEGAWRYRTIGLGYANMGAAIMCLGLPYDSQDARDVAAAITSLLTATSYGVSSEMAGRVGPFEAWERNRDSMADVMGRHAGAAGRAVSSASHPVAVEVGRRSIGIWDSVVGSARTGEGFRNAQCSLVAPTGTIGLAMGCDTTGIEPEFSLVKVKSLSGGGTMTIENGSVVRALGALGYGGPDVDGIVQYLREHGSIEGAPGLRDADLPVFDCAVAPPGGSRSIEPMGHVLMLAAAQPFLSGAISKTVNMPATATPDDIQKVYLEAYRLGLKCITVYRDGSKGSQPLTAGSPAPVERGAGSPAPVRTKVNADCNALRHRFQIGPAFEGYIHVGLYGGGMPGEVFVRATKNGSPVQGLLDSWSIGVSLMLQYGVPLSHITRKFAGQRFEPSGPTMNPDIPVASSVVDYVARWLDIRFLGGHRRTAGEGSDGGPPADGGGVDTSMVCPTCGVFMLRAGVCYSCPMCGESVGGCG